MIFIYRLQREIAASKRDRNYQPTFLTRGISSEDSVETPKSPDRKEKHQRGSTHSKRSAGSFSHNNDTDSFEADENSSSSDESSTTPKGYSYLPPINSTPIKQGAKGTTIKQKRTTRQPSHNGSPLDETDGREDESYCFMPPPKNTPATPDGSDENYCFMPKPKNTPATPDASDENYCFMPKPKNTPATPDASDESYCFMPKPKNMPLTGKKSNEYKSNQSVPASLETKDTENHDTTNENYCFLPPPKPVPSPDTNIPSRMTSNERITSDRKSIKHVTPIVPLKRLCEKNENESLEETGNEVDGGGNYHFLPSPKPSQKQSSPPTSMISDRLNNEKYTVSKHRPNRYVDDNINVNDINSKTDENYINFAPIQQMKMIAKNNTKAPPPTTSPHGNGVNNYMNFKY